MGKSPETGPSTPQGFERRLEASATTVLPELVAQLRADLLREASRLSADGSITAEELQCAYSHSTFASQRDNPTADAQLIVSRALRENRLVEWGAYGMALVLFLFGLILLSLGVLHGDLTTRAGALLSGSVTELLILLPFRVAINSRKHNIALRMVGHILAFAQNDRKVAAALLKDTFVAVVLGEIPSPGNKLSR